MRRRAARRAVALCGAAASAALLAACSSSPVAQPAQLPAPPLASAVADHGMVVAALPAGDLSQPVNTFWQLVVGRPGGRLALRTPVGVATNGGVSIASGAGAGLLVGVEASQLLRFSPVESSSNLGVAWATGVLPSALAPVPSDLARDGARVAALLADGSVDETSSALGGAWATTASRTALARSDRACDVGRVTAIAFASSRLVVGVSCRKGGSALLEQTASGSFRSLAVGDSTTATPSEALAAWGFDGAVRALIELGPATRARYELVSVSSFATVGESFPLDGTLSSVSFGDDVVTVATTQHALVLDGRWGRQPSDGGPLPALPGGAGVAIVLEAGGVLEALEVRQTVVDAYVLHGQHWAFSHRLAVPVQYGSSS